LGWLRDRSLADLAERRLEAARRLRDQAEAFYKAGTRSRIDLTRAETALQLAHADAARARLAERTSAIGLEAAVGEPGSASGDPVLPREPAVAARSVEGLVSLGLARPGLAAASARLRRAEAAQAGADRAAYPEFRADADAGVRTRDALASPNWSLGVTLTAPLFDGFATDRARQEAAAGTIAASEDLRAGRLAAEADVRRAALCALSARERLPATEAAVRHAAENLELAQGRYKAGVGSVIEVGDALVLVAGAQTDLTRDRTDYHLALADLLRAVGLTGLEDDAY
jgi:outer membrane protein TolC